MARGFQGAVLRHIHQLFEGAGCAGASEWQLLRRYVAGGDEAAFEAIVARHGPMVLGVCRRMLDDPHAVEDAFQATFLVLVRKAGSLGEGDPVGAWLYGVARRVALHARSDAIRRRRVERPTDVEVICQGDDPARSELASLLDGELGRLPPKYRDPLVLCCMEGLTHEEAARQLRWPLGTVKGRLARAKELLRHRLIRRGVVPSAFVLWAAQGTASAAVPDALLRATLLAAAQLSARPPVGSLPGSAVRLMKEVLSAMFATKLKAGAAVLGTCGGLVMGMWALAQAPDSPRTDPKGAPKEAKAERPKARSLPAPDLAGDADQAVRAWLTRPVALKFRDTPLGEVLREIRKETRTDANPGVPIFIDPEGLKEAGATLDTPVSVDAKDAPLSKSLDAMLRPLKLGATVRDGLLVVSSRPEIALIELRSLREELDGQGRLPAGQTGVEPTEAQSPKSWLERHEGGRLAYDASSGDLPEGFSTPENEARTKAILEALNKSVPVSFPQETPLEDVLKYVKSATAGPGLPEGLPIYVDPAALAWANQNMTTLVTIDLEGVRLRDTLRLIVRQVGLTYVVRDGLLAIQLESDAKKSSPFQVLAEKAQRGELSLRAMRHLVELFKMQEQVRELARGVEDSSPKGTSPGPAGAERAPSPGPAPGTADGPKGGPPAMASGALPKAREAPPAADAEDAAMTQRIQMALNRVVALKYHKASLENVVADIRELTSGPGLPEGIPIFISRAPNYLLGVHAQPETVTFELKGVKLKTALRLLLGQLGLAYTVKDGLLIIAAPGSPEIHTNGFR